MKFCICRNASEPAGCRAAFLEGATHVKDAKAYYAQMTGGQKPQCGSCFVEVVKDIRAKLDAQDANKTEPLPV